MQKTRSDQIFDAFCKFHKENPGIYRLFKEYAHQAIRAGRAHYSAKAVFERIRWHYEIETKGGDVKLNNNFTAYYARLFHVEHPVHDTFFKLRKRISEDKGATDDDSMAFQIQLPGDETRMLNRLYWMLRAA